VLATRSLVPDDAGAEERCGAGSAEDDESDEVDGVETGSPATAAGACVATPELGADGRDGLERCGGLRRLGAGLRLCGAGLERRGAGSLRTGATGPPLVRSWAFGIVGVA
jgi:hypothetical protein